jgi:gas vesicle protein
MSMSEQLQPINKSDEIAGKLAWFLTGAALGAAAALLYAPKTGRETRKAVTESSKDVIDAGRDMFERGRRLVEDASELFERGRRLVRG